MEIVIIVAVVIVLGFFVFRSFDKNKDGKVDKAEVKAAVHEAVCAPVVEAKVEVAPAATKTKQPSKKPVAKKTVAKKPVAKKTAAKKTTKK